MSQAGENAYDPVGTVEHEDGSTEDMLWSDWSAMVWEGFREREAARQAEFDRRAALMAPAWEQVMRLAIKSQEGRS